MAKMEMTIRGEPFTINYPDEMEGTITDDLAILYNYRPFINNPEAANDPTKPPMIENPASKLQFVINEVVKEMVNKLRDRVVNAAGAIARKTAEEAFAAKVAAISVQKNE